MTLKEYLKKHGISQNQAARDLGMTPATMSIMLTGIRTSTIKNILAVHAYTNGTVSIDTLIEPAKRDPRISAARTIGQIRRQDCKFKEEIEKKIDELNQKAKGGHPIPFTVEVVQNGNETP